jgi:mgtE-like transporter
VPRVLRADPRAAWAGFAALTLSCLGDLVTGLALGSLTGTLERLPGLIILVPAAIGMRGNVFGALGSRISTLAHQGRLRRPSHIDSVVGQNIAAAIVLSLSTAVVLAVLANAMSHAFGVAHPMSIAGFLAISVLAAAVSSVFLLVVTAGVAVVCVRRGLDLDNVAAPIVTTTGDLITVPSLFAATLVVTTPGVTTVIAVGCAAVAITAFVASLRRSSLPVTRRIVLESLPVLTLAGVVDLMAGATLQSRLESFLALPALLVLVPAFLEESGALGSILAARVATKLHLGVLGSPPRWRLVIDDVVLVVLYALPVYVMLGLVADIASVITGIATPGVFTMVLVSVVGGVFATAAAVVVGFYAATITNQLGLDPDNHGVAIVTSSLDFVGVFCLFLAIAILGVG